MVQVARRFEIAGLAATARRFELAEFEVGELQEQFEEEVPNAELPKEGPTAHIPAMAQVFLNANLPEMKKAAAAKDPVAFQDAFQRAASTCNACHQAAAKGFIQIPAVPGKAVPDLDPIASPGKAP
jgi:mono/diheme cytochrome c family protein